MKTSRRAKRSYLQRLDAPAVRVFPLICPVKEAEWLDGFIRMVKLWEKSLNHFLTTGQVLQIGDH